MECRLFFTAIIGIASSLVSAQDLEYMLSGSEEWGQADLSDIENVHFISESININQLDSAELVSTGIFQPYQAGKLVEYRKYYGEFISAYELQALDGFDEIFLLNYYHLLNTGMQDDSNAGSETSMVLRLETNLERSEAYRKGIYDGGPYRRLVRFRTNEKEKFSLGFLGESDRGEKLNFSNSNTGFDFFSAHYLREWQHSNTRLLIGDFSFQSGEGLIFGSGLNLGKNYQLLSRLKNAGSGLKPYTSSSESGFFRGMGITGHIGENFEWSIFGSHRKLDATLYGGAGEIYFKSERNNGYHRKISEQSTRNTVIENVGGSAIRIVRGNLKAGFNLAITNRNIDQKAGKNPEEKDFFEGNQHWIVGQQLEFTFHNMFYFSESALSGGRAPGTIQGILLNLGKGTEASFLFRYYSRGFHSIYGQAFGEFNRQSDETGYYFAVDHTLNRKVHFNCFADLYHHKWLKNGVMAPSYGSEYQINADLSLRGTAKLRIRLRNERKETNDKKGRIDELQSFQKRSALLFCTLPAWNKGEIRINWQGNLINEGGTYSTGNSLSLDLIGRFGHWSFSSRLMIFDIDNFKNRIYIYERDLEYSFSMPSFQEEGIRHYIMLRWKPNASWTFWLRYSRTSYTYLQTIGSSNDKIQGNNKTDLKFQVRYHFLSKMLP